MRFSIVFFFVYLRAFYRIVNAFVAKYLVAAVGRDVSSVAKIFPPKAFQTRPQGATSIYN
jgi:hypothetical protein